MWITNIFVFDICLCPRHLLATSLRHLSLTFVFVRDICLQHLSATFDCEVSAIFVFDICLRHLSAIFVFDINELDFLVCKINSILTWTNQNGYKFSHLKTGLIIFEKTKSKFPSPLFLRSHLVPKVETVKFLGLRFHHRHSWLPHLKELKAKSMRALNVLKYLSTPSTGCNSRVLLPLYKSLVRSILDYGAPVYGLASKSQLSILDPIQNAASARALSEQVRHPACMQTPASSHSIIVS